MSKIIVICGILVLAPLSTNAEGVSFETPAGSMYSAGGSFTVRENVRNDIVAAGVNVVISGSVGNDVLAAGGSVTVSGPAAGDVRAAGGSITLAGRTAGEAVVAGGSVVLLPESAVGQGLIAACGELTIEGTVNGGARITGGKIVLNGTIDQDVYIEAEELVIGRQAIIKGNLNYETPQEAKIATGAVIEGTKSFIRKEITPPGRRLAKAAGALWLLKAMASIAAALAVYYFVRKKTIQVTTLALERFGSELARGFIALIVIPAAILILFITVVGWLLGVLGLFFYIFLLVLSSVMGALVFTRWSSGYLFKRKTAFSWPVILLGVLIYQVIGLIPFFGWIITFVFFLAALGALAHLLYLGSKEEASGLLS